MSTDRIQYLVQQYLGNRLTPDEQAEFNELFKGDAAEYREAHWDPVFEQIMARADAAEAEKAHDGLVIAPSGGSFVRDEFRRMRWVAAACVLFFVAGTAWFLERGRAVHPVAMAEVKAAVAHDADPGGSKAILTLADGKTIALDSTQHGVIGRQGGEQLVSSNKQLVYRQVADVAGGVAYNILTTPRGGQYTVVLPDGTKVWLNADSYLRYPTNFSNFTGGSRVVELRGEGYFEVAANAHAPFRVQVLRRNGEPLQVDVLGTHFNIMAYDDEPVLRTTLLEGAVRVSKGAAAVVLRPGQQARLEGGNRLVVSEADVEEAVAWKNGLFKFDGASIGAVMRQLSRWYDLDVEYTKGEPKDLFQGELYRDVRLSELLKILQASGVHCAVEGKKLLVK